MAQLVGVDVADARGSGGFLDGFVDAGWWNGSSAFEQEQVAGLPGRAVGDPGVDEGFEGRVEGDVAVGVEFPDRGAKPVAGADLDDGVDA